MIKYITLLACLITLSAGASVKDAEETYSPSPRMEPNYAETDIEEDDDEEEEDADFSLG